MNKRFVQVVLDFVPAAIRVINNCSIIPESNFPDHMRSIFTINGRLERYVKAYCVKHFTLLAKTGTTEIVTADHENGINNPTTD